MCWTYAKYVSVIARSVLCDEAISKRNRDCFVKNTRNDVSISMCISPDMEDEIKFSPPTLYLKINARVAFVAISNPGNFRLSARAKIYRRRPLCALRARWLTRAWLPANMGMVRVMACVGTSFYTLKCPSPTCCLRDASASLITLTHSGSLNSAKGGSLNARCPFSPMPSAQVNGVSAQCRRILVTAALDLIGLGLHRKKTFLLLHNLITRVGERAGNSPDDWAAD